MGALAAGLAKAKKKKIRNNHGRDPMPVRL